MSEVSNEPYTTELREYEQTTPLGKSLQTKVNISCNDFETFCKIVTAVNSILKGENDVKYCIDCKHCIGEPTCFNLGDGNGFTQAYSCFKKNGKRGMFDCLEKGCEFFEVKSDE